jgi:glycosyltransferase involved in cell wall biosynthesis
VAGRELFRSGPSLRKVVLDLQLTRALRDLHRELRPSLVVAHHVEAAFAAAVVGARPLVFFAHTDLGEELPAYAPRARRVLRPAGAMIDLVLGAGADGLAAISPRLAAAFGSRAHYVPTPWPVPEPISDLERRSARAAFRLAPDDRVLLYAGNLDPYQGWEHVLGCARRLVHDEHRTKLVIATDSDPTTAIDLARRLGIADHLRLARLGDEARRRAVHACSDVAVVPRRTPGGLPIKLLDALARGVPVVAARRATGGLDLSSVASIVDDDDPDALAAGVRALGCAREYSSDRGRSYVGTAHAERAFLAAMNACARAANGLSSRRRDRLHSVEAPGCRGTSSSGSRAADRPSERRTFHPSYERAI